MLCRFEKSLQWERLFIVPFDLHITLIWLFQGSKLKTRSMQTKFQTNIMRHCCMQRVAHVWPPCINMLQHVATCWMVLGQFWKWSNFCCNIFGCCARLASFFTVSHNTIQQCWQLLRWNVACVLPGLKISLILKIMSWTHEENDTERGVRRIQCVTWSSSNSPKK